jgi:hypothetical protein
VPPDAPAPEPIQPQSSQPQASLLHSTEVQPTEAQATEAQAIEPQGGRGEVAAEESQAAEPEFPASWAVGTVVRLRLRPSYLKTADPMPMLRPPDLIGMDELGQVVEQRALGQIAVRFRRGTFLLAAAACEPGSD